MNPFRIVTAIDDEYKPRRVDIEDYVKLITKPQCNAIVQPGEYTIPIWDGERCLEKSPMHLAKCNSCGNYYCLTMHWGKHLDYSEIAGECVSQ
jgi:hypothetical protein